MTLVRTAALAALLLGASPAALAQTPPARSIAIGQTLQGELKKSDYDKEFEWIMNRFDLTLAKGEIVTISVISKAFDTYIDLDKGEEHVDADDDGGEVFDARLVFQASDAGTYRINVTSSGHDETGAYSVKVDRGGTPPVKAAAAPARNRPPAPAPTPIRIGQTVQGNLSETSPLTDDDTPYEGYSFAGKKGQSVLVEMKSKAFDSYLILRRKGYDAAVRTNDDGGEDVDAKLTAILPADGDYEILANSTEETSKGAFSLTLANGPPRVVAVPVALTYGQTLRGELKEGDAQGDDGSYYDLFRFKGRAGDKVSISVRSDDFDAFASLAIANGGRELANNDDAEDSSDAVITYTLPADIDYEVRATTIIKDDTGRYVIGISRAGN